MFANRLFLKKTRKEIALLRAQLAILLYAQNGVINSRKDFGHILNYLELTGIGVEVGVRKGNFSCYLLETWRGDKLYSIDPWRYFPDSGYIDTSNVEQKKQNKIYNEAKRKLSIFKDRSEIIRDVSIESAKKFDDGSLDFVYLDAQHQYEAVQKDIAAWYPKIKRGGVISGDDYANINTEEGVFGVKTAVDEFICHNNLKLILTVDGLFPSWFTIKK